MALIAIGYKAKDLPKVVAEQSGQFQQNSIQLWLADEVVTSLQLNPGGIQHVPNQSMRLLGVWHASSKPLSVGSEMWFTSDFHDSGPAKIEMLSRVGHDEYRVGLAGVGSNVLIVTLSTERPKEQTDTVQDFVAVQSASCSTVESCISEIMEYTLRSKLPSNYTVLRSHDTLTISDSANQSISVRLLPFTLPTNIVAEVVGFSGSDYSQTFSLHGYVAFSDVNGSVVLFDVELEEFDYKVSDRVLTTLQ